MGIFWHRRKAEAADSIAAVTEQQVSSDATVAAQSSY